MRSYEEFQDFLQKGRQAFYPGRKLCNNTRVYYRDNLSHLGDFPLRPITIMYHATEIITFHGDRFIDFNLNGWHTVSTFKRLNDYTPFSFQRCRYHEEEPFTVVGLDGGWLHNVRNLRRHFLVFDESHVIRVDLQDRRRAPWEVPCWPYGGSERLRSMQYWYRVFEKNYATAKKEAKQNRKAVNAARRSLKKALESIRELGLSEDRVTFEKSVPVVIALKEEYATRTRLLEQERQLIREDRRKLYTQISDLENSRRKFQRLYEQSLLDQEKIAEPFKARVATLQAELDKLKADLYIPAPDKRERVVALEDA